LVIGILSEGISFISIFTYECSIFAGFLPNTFESIASDDLLSDVLSCCELLFLYNTCTKLSTEHLLEIYSSIYDLKLYFTTIPSIYGVY